MKRIIFQPYIFPELRSLAENILYYDEVILWISQGFWLAKILGVSIFEKALERGVFKFIGTNANILPEYNIESREITIERSIEQLKENFYGPVYRENRDAGTQRVEGICKELANKCKLHLVHFLDSQTKEIGNSIHEATHRDENNLHVPEYLSDLLMNKLFTRQRLFTINLEIAILDKLKAQDFLSTPDLMTIHAAKYRLGNLTGENPTIEPDQARSIIWDLNSIEGIPDLGVLLDDGLLSLDELMEIRSSSDGKLFRKWFHKVREKEEDPNRIIEAYYETIKKCSAQGSLGERVLRFAIPTLIGAVSGLGGVIASGADAFVVEKLRSSWRPSFFLHDQLYATVAPRVYRKRKHQNEG